MSHIKIVRTADEYTKSMAAEVNARYNKQPVLSFTLPISCQVCLGKVKSPVLCPNNHVFCSTCLDVWLQKTKQCPACRVSMTAGKQIMGGLSHNEDNSEKLTNPELRKARFDILYKEYEDEFERLQSELHLLKTENQILKQQARKDGHSETRYAESSTDKNGLLVLTKKLQDANKQYEKVKTELSRLKQENSNMKDENVGLNRENQNLRQELAGRSPHRFGRTTVATLESKLASAEKDVSRLTKALERSDKYIEELEKELEGVRGGSSKSYTSSSAVKGDKYLTNGDHDSRKVSSDSKLPSAGYRPSENNPSKRKLFSDDRGSSNTGERYKYYDEHDDYSTDNYQDYRTSGKDIHSGAKNDAAAKEGKKRVTFDMEKNTHSTLSFDLEMPSPLKNSGNRSNLSINGRVSPVKGVLKKPNNKSSDKSNDNLSTDLSKTLDDSLSSSYNGKPSQKYSKDDDLLYTKGRSADKKYDRDTIGSVSRKKYSADDSFLDQPSEFRHTSSASTQGYRSKNMDEDFDRNYDSRSKYYDAPKSSSDAKRLKDRKLELDDLDDTQHIESELDELNISLTPEFTDCMKILNRAEKKVHTRDSDPEDEPVPSRYSSASDRNTDTAFRSSTGSLGTYQSTDSHDGVMNDYTKPDQSRFTSSLDSYSRGRHVRSGSLDNLYMGQASSQIERPGSALPSTANMLDPTVQKRYSSGLTTGRTSLTRAPSLDNLLMNRQSSTLSSKYSSSDETGSSRLNYPGMLGGRRFYGENENTTAGVGALTGRYDTGAGPSVDSFDKQSTFDSVLQARARSLAPDSVGTSVSSGMKGLDLDRNTAGSGRLTPSLPQSDMDMDRKYSSGRVTPTIPTHLEYMAANPGPDRYTSSTISGRLTPTLTNTAEYTSLRSQYGDGKVGDLSQKPPTGVRQTDNFSRTSMPNTNPASFANNPAPAGTYPASSYASQSLHKYGGGSSSINGIGGGGYDSQDVKSATGYSSIASSGQYDYKPDSVTSYHSDDKYAPSSYSDRNYKDGTDFSNFSSKVGGSSSTVPIPSSVYSSSSSSSNPHTSSASFAGSSLGSSTAYSVPYLPTSMSGPSSSYTNTAYSSSLNPSSTSSSSSSYPSSHTASTYSSKPLDPISEAGHYSYVSNVSGDYSKNDTFALPEPKKRLFDSNDDLDLSMSPIKSNKRF